MITIVLALLIILLSLAFTVWIIYLNRHKKFEHIGFGEKKN